MTCDLTDRLRAFHTDEADRHEAADLIDAIDALVGDPDWSDDDPRQTTAIRKLIHLLIGGLSVRKKNVRRSTMDSDPTVPIVVVIPNDPTWWVGTLDGWAVEVKMADGRVFLGTWRAGKIPGMFVIVDMDDEQLAYESVVDVAKVVVL